MVSSQIWSLNINKITITLHNDTRKNDHKNYCATLIYNQVCMKYCRPIKFKHFGLTIWFTHPPQILCWVSALLMVESLEPNVLVMYKDLSEIHTMNNGCKCNCFLGGNTCFAAHQDSTYHPVDTSLSLDVPKYKEVFVHYHHKIMYYIHNILKLKL